MLFLSNTFSVISNFILSLIVPSSDAGMSNLLWKEFGAALLEALLDKFYYICKWFLAFMDFLQYFIQKLIGLDYWLSPQDGGRTLSGATSEDMIFKFLYADSVQKVFRALCGLFVLLLIIFTIFAIIKSEWDYMTSDGSKGNSKAAVFRSSLKAIALVIVFPVLLVMGIVSSNAILASVINAVGIDTSETFGGKVFSVSAKSANKYRSYVDTNAFLPTSDKVTYYLDDARRQIVFGEKAVCSLSAQNCNDYHVHYKNYYDPSPEVDSYLEAINKGNKYEVNSIFDPLVPRDEADFSGFCYMVEDENENREYYFVKADKKTRDAVYYYLTRVLGANVLPKFNPSDSVGIALKKAIKFSQSCEGAYIEKCDIKKAKDPIVREVCRNTWNYSLIYANPGKSLSQALSSQGVQELSTYNLGDGGSAKGAIMYNSPEISGYFDGGQFGVVQSRAEYAVMADVVDFMCDNALTFYIMDVTSPLINWAYRYIENPNAQSPTYTNYQVESKWISSVHRAKIEAAGSGNPAYIGADASGFTFDGSNYLTFLTSYSDNGTLPAENSSDIIYTAKFDVGDESQGSRYIVCLKSEGVFYPLVNGKDVRIGNKIYQFKSDHYATGYNGVVWAKGTFDTNSIQAVTGNPTYMKSTKTTELDGENVVTDSDGAYYYSFDGTADNPVLNLYDFYTRRVGGWGVVGEYIATYNNGSLYTDKSELTFPTSLSGTNLTNKTFIANRSNVFGQFKCDYTFRGTGAQEVVGGITYYQLATESKGVCYVVYLRASDGKLFDSVMVGDKLTVNTENINNDYNLSGKKEIQACYLDGSRSRQIPGLVIKQVNLSGKAGLSDEADSLVKSTFSLFSGDEYFGTFTKQNLNSIHQYSGINNKTETFESYWGSKYYNINTVGRCKGNLSGELVGVQGKFNATLKFQANSAEEVMLEYYESAQTADAVSCCRYELENFARNDFGSTLIEVNIDLLKGIWELKAGTLQQVSKSVHPSWTFVFAGENEGITFDYFFDQNIELRTFYAATKIQYVILLISAALIIKVLFSSLWGVIKRFYMITLYYLAMPIAASTMPIDDGNRFRDVREKILGEVLSTYGVLIGLNVFFVLLAPIRDISSTIFTDEAIANSGSYFLKNLNIKAFVLNELIYILFLLVAFTLIKELPSLVQRMVGKGDSIDQTGDKVHENVKSTVSQAGQVISGQSALGAVKEGAQMIGGLMPGGALAKEAWNKGKEGMKKIVGNFEEGKNKIKEAAEKQKNSGEGGETQSNSREGGEAQSNSRAGSAENSRETENII